jgi:hypothetical protein
MFKALMSILVLSIGTPSMAQDASNLVLSRQNLNPLKTKLGMCYFSGGDKSAAAASDPRAAWYLEFKQKLINQREIFSKAEHVRFSLPSGMFSASFILGLDSNGNITSFELKKSSGSGIVDANAAELIKSASPFRFTTVDPTIRLDHCEVIFRSYPQVDASTIEIKPISTEK